jgi:carbamoyl-phosphate synthase small subunit
MTGYPQALTDPSFRGQILVSTYPLQGNYGVPVKPKTAEPYFDERGIPVHFESERIQAAGFVVAEACDEPSHFTSGCTLSVWLDKNNVPGICGIDTRALTIRLREHGVMRGKILVGGNSVSYGSRDVSLGNAVSKGNAVSSDSGIVASYGSAVPPVADVSPREPRVYAATPRDTIANGANTTGGAGGGSAVRIALIDCGAKANILRCLLARGVELIRLPWNHDLSGIDYDGLFLSNGPGDPKACGKTIATVRHAFERGKPIFGICLGVQIMALAAGADTYKLPYGHRGQNQPCIDAETGRCYITSQNHGYAVRGETLPKGWEPWFTNANDGTIEGIKSTRAPFSAVQFHPEGCPGPRDTEFLIDRFLEQALEAQRGRAL